MAAAAALSLWQSIEWDYPLMLHYLCGILPYRPEGETGFLRS